MKSTYVSVPDSYYKMQMSWANGWALISKAAEIIDWNILKHAEYEMQKTGAVIKQFSCDIVELYVSTGEKRDCDASIVWKTIFTLWWKGYESNMYTKCIFLSTVNITFFIWQTDMFTTPKLTINE